MNPKISSKALRSGLCVGLLCFASVAASANTLLTFQVDMTSAINNSQLNPATQIVCARGTFDGWGTPGFQLTNTPTSANPNLYTGTFNDTLDANGGPTIWQFAIATGTNINTYETSADYNNRAALLPATSGASETLPLVYWDDSGGPLVTNAITFSVDMSMQIELGAWDPSSDQVEIRGNINGWSGGSTMTNNPAILRTNYQGIVTSNVYQITLTAVTCTNAAMDFKYVTQPGTGWDSPAVSNQDNGGNRWFINNNSQDLPVVYFDDVSLALPVTNTVTFEVDMTTQIQAGNFTNGNTVEIHGDFNGWGSGLTMTNNPSSSDPNIYSIPITYNGGPGQEHYFKYVIQPGTQWENVSAANASGGNRYFYLADITTNFTNGPVYFSDEAPSALIDFVTTNDCMVTFTVQMTNAVGTDGSTFDNAYPTSDQIYLNGLNNGINNSFWTWAQAPFPGGPSQYQMNQIPNTTLFTITVPVNMGQNDLLIYKYSINGFDNEAGVGDNHERWIRSLPNYTMPMDTFDSQGSSSQIEPGMGNLTIAPAAGNQVQVSWLGRRGVELQGSTNLNSGVWTSQPLTDGTNLIVAPGGTATTNLNVAPGSLYLRLVGPN